MLRPSYTDLLEILKDKVDDDTLLSRYTIVIAAAKRARQLVDHAAPMTDHIPVDKPVSIAVTELAEGKIRIHAAKEAEAAEDEEMISEDLFIEWAKVHDNYYGTAISELEKANDNQVLILDIDIQGALYLKEKKIEAKYIFIEPPSIDSLKERLISRGSETEESIKLRLWNAKRELEYKDRFDIIIKNEDIDTAYRELENTINN